MRPQPRFSMSRIGRTAEEEHGAAVRVEDAGEGGLVGLLQRGAGEDRCRVDEDVDAAEPLDGLGDDTLALVHPPEVGGHRGGELAERRGALDQAVGGHVDHHDPAAAVHQEPADGRAEPAGRSGDDRDPSLVGHLLLGSPQVLGLLPADRAVVALRNLGRILVDVPCALHVRVAG